MSPNPYRLPDAVTPSHYALRIEPDLENAGFGGRVDIDLEIHRPTSVIELNAVDLQISRATLERNGTVIIATVRPDPDRQRAAIEFDAELSAGTGLLHLEFSGVLNDLLVGFYRSTFTDVEGVEQVIATTQFEATDARRAFPCFDEPSFKATFGITLVVPAELMAISNGPEIGRTPVGAGKVAVTFADTMRMSTYLVAMIVGPFEATEPMMVEGVPTRIVTPRGRLHLAEFALECGVFVLDYFRRYYGIPYPGLKLDHVAIPDFAFGAMENLGCITYRESSLLVDQEQSSQVERLRVLDVIGHEIAHMWFGDLVTMEWWDGIWLNEAFATFMEMKSTDAAHPEWKRWLGFAAEERPWAFGIDSLHTSRPVEFEVTSPEEANEMFDALTYGKGSSVLRMIEQFMGEEVFRRGVGTYLSRHAFGNTVTADLWAALDQEAGLDVSTIMNTWIHQRGFPQVEIGIDGHRVHLRQRRYLSIPDETDTTRWKIPIKLRGTAGGNAFELDLLLDEWDHMIDLDGEVDWMVGNAGGHGYFRTLYGSNEQARLTGGLERLSELERFCLIDDSWAFVESDQITVGRYLDLVTAYRKENEQAIVQQMLKHLGVISHHLVTDEVRSRFEIWLADLLAPLFDRLGWEVRPTDSELDRRLRGQVITALGRIAHQPEVIEQARPIAARWLVDPNGIDPDIAQAALLALADADGPRVWSSFMDAHRRTDNPQRKIRLLHAMAGGDHPETSMATLAAIRGGDIRSQDAAWVAGNLLGGRKTGGVAWKELRNDWTQYTSKMPAMTIRRMIEGVPALSETALANDVRSFFSETQVPDAERGVSQQLERLEVNIRLRASQTGRLLEYFG